MNYLLVILVLSFVIAIHELGHAIAAAVWGIPIKEIHIGWPFPPMFKFQVKGKPVTVSPWLAGAALSVDEEKIDNLHFLKRISILFAGPLANLGAFTATAFMLGGLKNGWMIISEFLTIYLTLTKEIFTGGALKDLVGPVGIVDVGGEILNSEGLPGFLLLWFLLNVALAIFNLLPIPAMDGGGIVLTAISGAFGDTPQMKRATNVISGCFTYVLVAAFILITFRDIVNIFR